MVQPFDWSALPVQILKDACELQSDALDNCAAACACEGWGGAVNSSAIGTLHLHFDTHSPNVFTDTIQQHSDIDQPPDSTLPRSQTKIAPDLSHPITQQRLAGKLGIEAMLFFCVFSLSSVIAEAS